VLSSAGDFNGFKFVNIEQATFDDIKKELGLEDYSAVSSTSQIPEDDVTNFCLWLKNTLSSKVATVKLSQRLTTTPAILVGQMSSSMYMMMQML
jgi:HSP90 family molecular chaperone